MGRLRSGLRHLAILRNTVPIQLYAQHTTRSRPYCQSQGFCYRFLLGIVAQSNDKNITAQLTYAYGWRYRGSKRGSYRYGFGFGFGCLYWRFFLCTRARSYTIGARSPGLRHQCDIGKKVAKRKMCKNIQQRGFASGHPPNY